MDLDFSTVFKKTLKGLPGERQESVRATLKKFRDDPQRPGLNREKLTGDYISIRVNGGWRIILKVTGRDSYTAVNVGPHDIYRRYA